MDVADRLAEGRGMLLREPRRPAVVRERPGAFWLAIAAVCVGAFMGQLDASIVTVTLPTLQRSFSAGLGAVTWVGLGYLVVLVSLVTAVGRASDVLGRKLVYLYGFLVFVVGSALCGLAPTLGTLVVFRVLQGVGAAMLQANSVAIVTVAAPSRRLGRAIGVQGAAQAVGLALGPSIGGALLAVGGWRLIFLVNVPFGLLGLAAGWAFIPRSRHLRPQRRFDRVGLALFVPTVAALLSAVSFGDREGWGSPLIVGLLAVTAVLAAAFVAWERHVADPLLDLRLFRRGAFSMGIASGLLAYLVTFGVLFVVPFLFERALGLGLAQAGLDLMVMPVALGVTAPVAGRLADRVGPRVLTTAGMATVTVALVAFAAAHGSVAVALIDLAAVGVGLGLFTPPNNAAIMGSVPRRDAGVASGVLNTTRGLGTAMGLAFAGLVYGAAGGTAPAGGADAHAFGVTAVFLAATAAVAGLVAARRTAVPLSAHPAARLE